MIIKQMIQQKKLKILVIDGDANSRSQLRKDLQTAHCDAITAENEKEGTFLAAAIQPDVLLIEAQSSPLDIAALADQLSAQPTTAHIPVIFVTEADAVQELLTDSAVPAADYITKPYTMKELQARIHKAVLFKQEQLKEKAEIQKHKNSFVAMLAEEFRKPISVISGFSELLERKGARMEPLLQNAYIQEIVQQSDYLGNLLDDYLYLLRTNQVLEQVNVSQAVTSAVEKIEKSVQEKGQKMIVHLPDRGGIFIQGNGRNLLMAVKHLLSNAHRFTPPGGTITVSVIPRELWLRIEISDTGAGVPPSQKLWIFQRFRQVPRKSPDEQGGIGLGLMIAKSVAEQHHGTIGFESTGRQGSRFWLELPMGNGH